LRILCLPLCSSSYDPHISPTAAQFVKLHSEPLLQQLYHNFQQQYPGITFPPPPQAGTLNLEDVLRSQYFFS